MSSDADAQYRAIFDAELSFTNGGGLWARDFRLDIPGPETGHEALGELFLRHLDLLMAADVAISNVRVVQEAHKGSRDTAAGNVPGGRRIVELSHVIEHGLMTYPGLPGPEIGEFLTREASRASYAPGTEFSIGRINMVGNTGTYLDSPFHRFADGPDVAALALTQLADLDGVVIRLTGSGERVIERWALVSHEVRGRAALLHTGWDRHWAGDAYGSGEHPFLAADAAAWLAEQGAALVGIDSLNIDDTTDPSRPAHTTLLGAGIPIVEHLTGLEQLPVAGFRFHAVPAPVAGMTSWPVRAYAVTG